MQEKYTGQSVERGGVGNKVNKREKGEGVGV